MSTAIGGLALVIFLVFNYEKDPALSLIEDADAKSRANSVVPLNCIEIHAGTGRDDRVEIFMCPHPNDPGGHCLVSRAGDIECVPTYRAQRTI
jgi:hypothetical protein